MADFAEGVSDQRAGRILARAIEGKGAFGRFKDRLHRDYPELVPAWHAFQSIRAKRRAVQWLVDNSLLDQRAAAIEPLLPPVKGAMGRPCAPHRPVVEGIVFRHRAGCRGGICRRGSGRGRRWAPPNDKDRPAGRDEPVDHGIGRSRGGLSTKAHLLVDGRGRCPSRRSPRRSR
jgi:transposase